MMTRFLLIAALLLAIAGPAVRADLLDCEEKTPLSAVGDFVGIGPKVASEEVSSGEHDMRAFLKTVGCSIKKGATKVTEQAKKLGVELKERAKKLGERAKVLGSEFKTKFNDFKEKISTDSAEEQNVHRLMSNVEIIDPDVLKAEQQCGHGHILDALGNCSKLRK